MGTLILRYDVGPPTGEKNEQYLQLTVEPRKNDGQSNLFTYQDICDYNQLSKLSKKMSAILKEAAKVGADCSGHLKKLRMLGEDLRGLLLPPEVSENLKRDGSLHHVLIRCDPRLNCVPYGLIFIQDDYLCFKCNWVYTCYVSWQC